MHVHKIDVQVHTQNICKIALVPGGLLSPKLYVDVPAEPEQSDYLYTNFLPNFPPISIPFSEEKHPIWPNWVLLTIICPKYTQFM